MYIVCGKVSTGVETIIRLASVKRWHIIDTLRTQTLAEHSCSVALLAGEIARRLGEPDAPYIKWGLMHDAHEAYTGDLPTSAKNDGHEAAEREVELHLGIERPSIRVQWVVKICDIADALRFIRLYKSDHLGQWAEAKLEEKLDAWYQMLSTSASVQLAATIKDVVTEYIYERKNAVGLAEEQYGD